MVGPRKEEKRFPYYETVLTLKQFLLEKKKKLDLDREEEIIPKKNAYLARKYSNQLSEIIRTEYFWSEKYSMKVGELMLQLKKDDRSLVDEIANYETRIEKTKALIMHRSSQISDGTTLLDSYQIPDERELYLDAMKAHVREQQMELQRIQEEQKVYQYRLKLCRALKGIIHRPNGYFNALYKI